MKVLKSFKNKFAVLLVLLIVTIMCSACSNNSKDKSSDESQVGQAKDIRSIGITDPYVNPDVKFSNLTSEEEKSVLIKDLEQAGIKKSYINDYINYVDIYNKTVPDSVLNGWNILDKVNYDSYEIADKWVEKILILLVFAVEWQYLLC